MGRLFPCEWEPFAGTVPAAERGGDLAAAYARLLADPYPQARAQAARQWCAWEDTHMSLTPGWAPNLSHRDPGSLDTAWHLHRAWPNSKLIVLNDAGHGGGGYTSELVGALDSFRTLP
ncbi:MAG TPA: hypothetical protein VGO16_00300 [Pseudonocardiaceae bacterium]|jgi:proline iminopeptidase|nr:hypothetical protein [Pseudonocardiaceae bacterium]